MELVSYSSVGVAIALVALLIAGPFFVYGVIKIIGFENSNLLNATKCFVSYLGIWIVTGLVSAFVFGLFVPVPADSPPELSGPRSLSVSIQWLIGVGIAVYFMKYWFKESWDKVIFASFLLSTLVSVFMFVVVVATMLYFATQMAG